MSVLKIISIILIFLLTLRFFMLETFQNSIEITSSSFSNEGIVDKNNVCGDKDGNNNTPQISFSHPEDDSIKSYALLFEDLDAPHDRDQNWVHWCVPYLNIVKNNDIIKNEVSIPEIYTEDIDTLKVGEDQRDMIQGINSWDKLGYRGPCPPIGNEHRYKLSVWALDIEIKNEKRCDKPTLLNSIEGHIIFDGEMVVKYQYYG